MIRYVPGDRRREIEAARAEIEKINFRKRLWAKDPTLWAAHAETNQAIKNRLGWLELPLEMSGRVAEILDFADRFREAGDRPVRLLGMGGSSLAASLLGDLFGRRPLPSLTVLDTTDPMTVAAALKDLKPEESLFLVSSKSGGTIEVDALYRICRERAPAGCFVAITDAGTPLDALSRERGFHHRFLNPPDVGGRYSALSFFGLVPAALVGAPLRPLLQAAVEMARTCGPETPAEQNPAVRLGAFLAGCALGGRDKVTFFLPRDLRRLGDWLEQLLAESLGKEGKGVIPVVGDPPADPEAYGPDRVFVAYLSERAADPGLESLLAKLEDAGHPIVLIPFRDAPDVGAEIFRWEVATAAAGALLGVNPFDEPNVAESKKNTAAMLGLWERGAPAPRTPVAEVAGLRLFGAESQARETREDSMRNLIEKFLDGLRPPQYLALLAFLPETPDTDASLERLRAAIRDRFGVATTAGYGPRYLHSTGQLHKGGPPIGCYVLLTHPSREEIPIPGRPYTLGTLYHAQAAGDFAALDRRGRPIIEIEIAGDIPSGLGNLKQLLTYA